jgi:hypothetical protein
VRGKPPDIRLKGREQAKLILDEFHAWLLDTRRQLSKKSGLAEAIGYALNHWQALIRYALDGRIEIDNNAAERALRAVALGRKNFLFAGSDAGGDRAAAIYSLVGSAKLNGGGRKKLAQTDPTLLSDLELLIDPVTRGDPESPLRWTCKSLRKLADELRRQGHQVSHVAVGELLKAQGYSLQANAKTLEGGDHPDRDAQFIQINACVGAALEAGEPVISVDTKKKELVGVYKNAGREWEKAGEPVEVKVHDFIDPELGRANPYGVYDVGADQGWVSVGTDHDTAAFAVESIRRWWLAMGQAMYPPGQ